MLHSVSVQNAHIVAAPLSPPTIPQSPSALLAPAQRPIIGRTGERIENPAK